MNVMGQTTLLERFLLVAAVLLASTGSASKILLVPMPVSSHIQGQAAVASELVSRGHEVHVFYPADMPINSQLSDITRPVTVHVYARPDLGRPTDFEEVYENINRMILERGASVHEVMNYMLPISEMECVRILQHNEELFTKLARVKFDIALVDGLFMLKCLYLVPHRLGIPWITHTDSLEPWLVRTPWLPSFAPMSLVTFADKMNFFERVQNTLIVFALSCLVPIPGPPEELLDRYRREFGAFHNLDELVQNSSLWITSRHLVSDYAKPSMPNMIDAGGLTVKPASTKPLPEELADFVAGAPKGVILVTFGSMASVFPYELTQKFIRAFESFSEDYRFIWRWNKRDEKIFVPKNVYVSGWLPQNELLAHPRTLLFITHGGNNGQMEAIYHAKPMIGFPLNGDQPYNVRRMAHKGYGLAMDIHDFTTEQLVNNIREVITNPSYAARIRHASEIFRCDVQRPAEKVVWWIEHVIKFGGDHLRSAGNDLYWFQYWLIDVIFFFFIIIVAGVVLAYATCRRVCRMCCSSHDKVNSKESRKKKQ